MFYLGTLACACPVHRPCFCHCNLIKQLYVHFLSPSHCVSVVKTCDALTRYSQAKKIVSLRIYMCCPGILKCNSFSLALSIPVTTTSHDLSPTKTVTQNMTSQSKRCITVQCLPCPSSEVSLSLLALKNDSRHDKVCGHSAA